MPASGAVDGGLCAVGAGGEVERGVGRYSSAIYGKEKGMKLGKMKVNIEFVGAEKLHEAIDDVKNKAEELEQAIQRLNEIELELKTKSIDK
ncbi:hypothetical protein [Streptococcus suis]|nr:hypothetical protein [Streptococcus suis]MCB2884290.1 hypothetical protein [Streptococcus suis]MCB2892294.1 hypothetical protein [Streptococcus suis]MCQ8256047.1 hypothetical protein [Streptococcus suis]MDW8753910.1 hypothetical protein [Streptococcus suis]MDX5052829.1 hypothetical protein [Streptococcus suis]